MIIIGPFKVLLFKLWPLVYKSQLHTTVIIELKSTEKVLTKDIYGLAFFFFFKVQYLVNCEWSLQITTCWSVVLDVKNVSQKRIASLFLVPFLVLHHHLLGLSLSPIVIFVGKESYSSEDWCMNHSIGSYSKFDFLLKRINNSTFSFMSCLISFNP